MYEDLCKRPETNTIKSTQTLTVRVLQCCTEQVNFLTYAAFKTVISQEVPNVGYLTLLDWYVPAPRTIS
jgi:hypothetical protein|eukprot:COSAG06_NODE_1632_length_8855_cov_44.798310_5_plen_69_part_00